MKTNTTPILDKTSPLIKLQVKRESFLDLSDLTVIGSYSSTRLEGIKKVKRLSAGFPTGRVVYFPNGVFGDVCKKTYGQEDLIKLLFILTSNEIKYAVFYRGEFEAGIEPNAEGRLI